MLAFPSSAESVDSWLEAINMARYKPVFEKAGITQMAQLCCLTDEQVQAAGVALVGHRKRLLQAMKELTPPAQGAPLTDSSRRTPRARAKSRQLLCPSHPCRLARACHTAMEAEPSFAPPGEQPPPAAQAVPSQPEAMDVGGAPGGDAPMQGAQQQRFNSTSSIFITSTISKPDIDEIIFCVAVVIHDRIVQGEQAGYDARSRFPFFSEDNNPLYAEPNSAQQQGGRERQEGAAGVASDDGSSKKPRREVPTEETIYYTIRSVYDCARFPSECLIVSLVYMERLIAFSQVARRRRKERGGTEGE